MALKTAKLWEKSKVPILAVISKFRFHLLHLCSRNSDPEAAEAAPEVHDLIDEFERLDQQAALTTRESKPS
jgi:hypothetical protein